MNLPQICSSKTMDSQVDGTYNSVSSAICSEKRLSIFFPESLLFFHLLPNYNYMMLVVELLLSEIGEFSLQKTVDVLTGFVKKSNVIFLFDTSHEFNCFEILYYHSLCREVISYQYILIRKNQMTVILTNKEMQQPSIQQLQAPLLSDSSMDTSLRHICTEMPSTSLVPMIIRLNLLKWHDIEHRYRVHS